MTATPPNGNGTNGQQPQWGQAQHGAPGYGPSSGGPGQPGYPQGPYIQPPQPMRPEDQRLWSTLVHIGGIFFSFIPALIGYLVLRDRGQFVKDHTRAALNFQLTLLIIYIVSGILTVVFIGGLIAVAASVFSLIVSIIAAVAANQGRPYQYPLTIQFVKN